MVGIIFGVIFALIIIIGLWVLIDEKCCNGASCLFIITCLSCFDGCNNCDCNCNC